ncbi:unnamed protein product [Pleuronectes platessa]|uniref:Uncharacterized protein n=1 Tax=Pleuronectes platessa TaxID=8262 RepID=A0A9N7VQK9_PLEPL|nr:unnamed protein product [Pleuronectes platessa]
MGKPLSRPGCFRKSSCCLEKHGAGDGRVGGRDVGVEGGYGDGYIPQRSIYDTMCINQQIDSHHHHPGESIRRDAGGDANFIYSASGSLRHREFPPHPRNTTITTTITMETAQRAEMVNIPGKSYHLRNISSDTILQYFSPLPSLAPVSLRVCAVPLPRSFSQGITLKPRVLGCHHPKSLDDHPTVPRWSNSLLMTLSRTLGSGEEDGDAPSPSPSPNAAPRMGTCAVALEKRRPHALLHPRTGHFSENPLSSVINSTSIVGRCSLKEPSHSESAQVVSLVGRASLKEQNLENWRVYSEQEEPRRSRSKEKQGEQSKENREQTTERQNRRGKEEKKEKEKREERDKKEYKVDKIKEKVTVSKGILEETKQEMRRMEEKVQVISPKTTEVRIERDEEIMSERLVGRDTMIKVEIQEQHEQELEVVTLQKEEVELEGGEGGTLGEEGGMERWEDVLDVVNTLWDDGWEKGGAGGEGDTDSLSGSLPRWPLLRPPVGFGGSHPPSSAASELSLTELERRARELDSDLEHLDLSQPHRDSQDLYQTLPEPQRADMYQTHPGPQREKAVPVTGLGSRSQVILELTTMASPATDTDITADWSNQSAGTSAVGTSSTKEDSSPDSNLTLESDSSGVFLSLSNQSQEETGSDSDQPVSGSDLGSSTSLEKDGNDGVLKEWGREESAELQWCYPSLLNTSSHEDIEGYVEKEEVESGMMEGEEERGKDRKIGVVSIMKSSIHHTDFEDLSALNDPSSQEIPPRKKVTVMGSDYPLPLSPSKPLKHFFDPNQKPIRTSGLDCDRVSM